MLALAAGCGGPSAANIELRKQNQDLRDQIEHLTRTHEADAASLRAMEARTSSAGTVTPALPADRLAALFTTHGIELGRLTGGWDSDREKPGDEGVRVQLTPTDDEGQKLKAAGAMVVDLFDLALPTDQRIGHWEIDGKTMRAAWLGSAFQYSYVIKLPWQRTPAHAELTMKVTFKDELTGREFSGQKVFTVAMPTAGK